MEPTLIHQNLPTTPSSVSKKMIIYENIDAYNKLLQQQHQPHKMMNHNSSAQSLL